GIGRQPVYLHAVVPVRGRSIVPMAGARRRRARDAGAMDGPGTNETPPPGGRRGRSISSGQGADQQLEQPAANLLRKQVKSSTFRTGGWVLLSQFAYELAAAK